MRLLQEWDREDTVVIRWVCEWEIGEEREEGVNRFDIEYEGQKVKWVIIGYRW